MFNVGQKCLKWLYTIWLLLPKRATAVLFDTAGQHFTRKDLNINNITSYERSNLILNILKKEINKYWTEEMSVVGKSDGSIAGIKNLLPSQLLQVHVALNLPSNQRTSLVRLEWIQWKNNHLTYIIFLVASLATPEEKPASPELKSRLVSTYNFILFNSIFLIFKVLKYFPVFYQYWIFSTFNRYYW